MCYLTVGNVCTCTLCMPCSVKYSGLLGLACVGLLTVCDLWQLLADKAIDMVLYIHIALTIFTSSVTSSLQADLALHSLLRGVYLLGIPLLMNVFLFYIHFAVLSQAGPGNPFVSLPFRNSLQVLSNIIQLVCIYSPSRDPWQHPWLSYHPTPHVSLVLTELPRKCFN